ncbi:MAG TPA: hypothetical protein VIJ25_02610, partial [Methylococcales bacterium]
MRERFFKIGVVGLLLLIMSIPTQFILAGMTGGGTVSTGESVSITVNDPIRKIGDEISIYSATNARPGAATAAHIQALELDNAKVTNATHTGDVTGSTQLTIAAGHIYAAALAMTEAAVNGYSFKYDAVTGKFTPYDPNTFTGPITIGGTPAIVSNASISTIKQIYNVPVTDVIVSSAATLNAYIREHNITLVSGNNNLTISNPVDGEVIVLNLYQPSSGAAGTVTFSPIPIPEGGTLPVLTVTNSAYDMVVLKYNGTKSKWVISSAM